MRASRLLGMFVCVLAAGMCGLKLHADEGMWTFDNLPVQQLQEKYGFTPTPEWVENLRMASVRFNSGGSGSFVSPNGLVMTNHHVGADTLAKISTKEKDYYKTGFYARSLAEEVKSPDLELNVLVGIADVTERVNAAVKEGMSPAEAGLARRKASAEIEKESFDKTGLRSDVVTLYQGGRYALYTYKKYTDVRLVFAPEFDIAFFGGDPDNFEFPRYDLDVCFFRVYEDGKPAQIKHYLKWSKDGAKDGELVFVSGHPGRTSRLFTYDHLEYVRDYQMPFTLEMLRNREEHLTAWSRRGVEEARQAKEDLFSIQNSRKARIGGMGGLKDSAFMARKKAAEEGVRGQVTQNTKLKAEYGDAWTKISQAMAKAPEIALPYNMLERGLAFDSQLFGIARTLVRLAEERQKPNAERLREYGEAGMASLEQRLYSEAPVYPEYEASKLANSLAFFVAKMGADHPLVKQVLAGRAPQEAAQALVSGSKLADVAVRKKLAEGGKAAIDACDDPMIGLAKLVDAESRAIRKRIEDELEGVTTPAYGQIAQAIFALQGDKVYPDATFTLRLSYGTISSYEQDGKRIAPFTTIGGAFEHASAHGNKPPYELPASWIEAKKTGALKLDTPFNFVSTADIIGGNSGSPTVNRAGEVVGLIFDGNIQSLVLDFGYDDVQARAVSVDSRAIAHALQAVYGAEALYNELTGRGVEAKAAAE